MSDIIFYIGIAIILAIVLTPLLLYSLGKYRVPASLGAAVRNNLTLAGGGVAGTALMNVLDPPRDGPNWYLMLGMVTGALLGLALDAYMIRRERLRGAL